LGKKDRFERIEQVVLVCNGKDCKKRGAKELRRTARSTLREMGKRRSTHIVQTKCNGFCKLAPIVSIQPHNVWLSETDEEELAEVLQELLKE
jgi:NADH:ubiquinone oxidoreductase subunit E